GDLVPHSVHARELRPHRGAAPATHGSARVPRGPRPRRPGPHGGREPRPCDRSVRIPATRRRGRPGGPGRVVRGGPVARDRAPLPLLRWGTPGSDGNRGEAEGRAPRRPRREGGPVRPRPVPGLPPAAG